MATRLRDLSKRLDKIATEELTRGILAKGEGTLIPEMIHDIRRDGFTIFASPSLHYANYGARPGTFPSIKALKPWMQRRGIPLRDAYPIARKIAKDGTKPKKYWEDLSDIVEKSKYSVRKWAVDLTVTTINETITIKK